MISVSEALQAVLSEIPLTAIESVPLSDSLSRALAEAVTSSRDVPAFRNSAMDGFALRAADLGEPPVRLRILEVIAAGKVPVHAIRAGTAAAIMTGAVVPDGADTVVKVEDTESADGQVTIRVPATAGANIRHPGEDIRRGDAVFSAGHRLRAADIGVLASLGRSTLTVRRRPVVAILATGDELVEPEQELAPGQIVNSNAYTLAAAVEQVGALPLRLGVVRDDPAATRAAFARALEADVVVSTGGVSMGTFDLVRETLAGLGVRERFWKVAQRPGKPLSFGMRDAVPVFGLPGNPVSSLVCFYVYVAPVLRAMQGLRDIYPATVTVTAAEPIRSAGGLTDFVRCVLEGPLDDLRARSTGTQSSGALRSMSLGDALLISPPEQSAIEVGDRIKALLFDGPLSDIAPV